MNIFTPETIEMGSGQWWAKEVQSDGTDLAAPDTFGRLPRLKDSTLTFEQSSAAAGDTKLVAEGKEELDVYSATTAGGSSSSGGTSLSGKFSGTIYQIDKLAVDFLVQSVGKYYLVVKERTGGAKPNGMYEYLAFIGRFTGNVTVKQVGAEQPFEMSLTRVSADVTVNLAVVPFTDSAAKDLTVGGPYSITIPQDSNYAIAEI